MPLFQHGRDILSNCQGRRYTRQSGRWTKTIVRGLERDWIVCSGPFNRLVRDIGSGGAGNSMGASKTLELPGGNHCNGCERRIAMGPGEGLVSFWQKDCNRSVAPIAILLCERLERFSPKRYSVLPATIESNTFPSDCSATTIVAPVLSSLKSHEVMHPSSTGM